MTIPAARHPAPALPMVLALMGLTDAVMGLSLTWIYTRPFSLELRHLLALGCTCMWAGTLLACAVLALGLARRQRSPGAALAAAAAIANALTVAPFVVAVYSWTSIHEPWRFHFIRLVYWVDMASGVAMTAGLAWAAWADRSVRVVVAAAVGATLMSAPVPPLHEWLGRHVVTSDLGWLRSWAMTLVVAFGSAVWGLLMAWIAHRIPRVPVDAMAPRPPARALRGFAAASVTMAVVAIVAGLVIAVVQGKPASETGSLGLYIPIAVGLATAGVAAALFALAITDVGARASRRFTLAAILVTWCATVTAAQTLWSRRPQQPGARFTVFESPWMPGMVGAAVAVAALLAMTSALDATARELGQRPSRAQGAIVVLALVIGAATVPWLLGFGTRALPMDGLRIATLASAAAVNLAAWMALARAAWRCAASVPR